MNRTSWSSWFQAPGCHGCETSGLCGGDDAAAYGAGADGVEGVTLLRIELPEQPLASTPTGVPVSTSLQRMVWNPHSAESRKGLQTYDMAPDDTSKLES